MDGNRLTKRILDRSDTKIKTTMPYFIIIKKDLRTLEIKPEDAFDKSLFRRIILTNRINRDNQSTRRRGPSGSQYTRYNLEDTSAIGLNKRRLNRIVTITLYDKSGGVQLDVSEYSWFLWKRKMKSYRSQNICNYSKRVYV